jgi:hypothetical protein
MERRRGAIDATRHVERLLAGAGRALDLGQASVDEGDDLIATRSGDGHGLFASGDLRPICNPVPSIEFVSDLTLIRR